MFARRRVLEGLVGLGVVVVAHPTSVPANGSLAMYRWNARPLLIFAPTANDDRYRRQLKLLEASRAGMEERDMVLLAILGDDPKVGVLLGAPEALNAHDLRNRFQIPAEQFTTILVGKDGGSKARYADPVEPATIFQLIDGMPMRRREMRERGQSS